MFNPIVFCFKRGVRSELQALHPIVTVPQTFDLTTMSHCADWWNARLYKTDSSGHNNEDCNFYLIIDVIFLILLQMISPVINEHALQLILKVFCGTHQSLAQLLCF